jgi:rhamnogalacturonan endolyase
VQDETWQRADGSFITKYDLSTFLPNVEGDLSFWGVYGLLGGQNGAEKVGSWYIHGGKDYLNGDHLKQELIVHRESITGDAVQLNMIHGTHFQAYSSDAFPVGKTWGPWLWYLVSFLSVK